jgi:threonine dehydrogenase-like Zn-dependent dehydrogenase
MIAKNLLPLDEIITHKFPLQEFEKGIKMVVDSAQSIKVMLYHTNSTQ